MDGWMDNFLLIAMMVFTPVVTFAYLYITFFKAQIFSNQ